MHYNYQHWLNNTPQNRILAKTASQSQPQQVQLQDGKNLVTQSPHEMRRLPSHELANFASGDRGCEWLTSSERVALSEVLGTFGYRTWS